MCDRDTIVETNKIIVMGNVPPASNEKVHQRNWIYSSSGICPSLCATDYKDPKRVLIGDIDNEKD